MPVGTPFHERTFALCESLNYREWSGYYTVSSYETHHEHEYNAIRNAAALIDISPLFKYVITGRDAARLVDRVITRDVSTMDVGRVFYTPWCDEEGFVIDDGTVARLAETTFRMTVGRSDAAMARAERARIRRQRRRCLGAERRRWPCRGRAPQTCFVRARPQTSIGLRYFHVTSGTIHGSAGRHLANGIHRRPWLRSLGRRAGGGRGVGRADGGRPGDGHQAGRACWRWTSPASRRVSCWPMSTTLAAGRR